QQRPTTILARWFIDFTRCTEPTDPDPGAPGVWNNNQPFNWVVGGLYTGTYHPNMGCLEDFDMGSANGDWTLRVTSNRLGAQGALIYFRLIFCDDRGFDCCFSDAGNLNEPKLVRCVDHPDLDLSPAPFYNQPRPDTNEYGYTYLIAQDGIYHRLDSLADLTSEVPGTYEVCGLSYRRDDFSNIPVPDGVLTLEAIRSDLAALEPTFCGDLTPSCYQVNILPVPDTTFLSQTICTGDAVTIGTDVYGTTGIHITDLIGQGECDSIVVLDLEVVDQLENFIDTVLCFDSQIIVAGTPYDQPGVYRDTIPSSFGCDSIIQLTLDIRDEIRTDTSRAICAGDTVFVGGEAFFATGVYERVLISSLTGCDSTVTLDLNVLDPQIVILPSSPIINCFQETITLDASNSSSQFA
ncbi:MAG: hypothetical protein AAFU03_17070, partial [Bacteroidota bacterium]